MVQLLSISTLKIGDTIRIVGGNHDSTNFIQKVGSMRLNDKPINTTNPGDLIGLKIKVEERARKNYRVYKIT